MLNKNAHYRLATYLQARGAANLAEILNTGYAAGRLNNSNIADFAYGPTLQCIATRYEPAQAAYMFHFVVYEAGATAPTVTRLQNSMQLGEVSTANANEEFIKNQLFLYVNGHHSLFVTHNNTLRGDGVLSLTHSLANIGRQAAQQFMFGLSKVGNEAALGEVFDKGIEFIDLGLGNFAESLDMFLTGGTIKEGALRSFMGRDDYTEDEERAMADTRAKLILYPSRRWKRNNVKNLLKTVAIDAKNYHDDDFAIKVKGGPRLTQDKLTVQRQIIVEGSKALVNANDMALKLHEAYVAMRAERIIG